MRCFHGLLPYLCTMISSAASANGAKNIRHISLTELENFLILLGEKKFRAKQIWEWIWQKGARSFADMTNLSKDLRQQLGEHFSLPAMQLHTTQHSNDGTIKTGFVTHLKPLRFV